MLSTYQY